MEFAGSTLTMQEIYDQHHVGRRFIKRNYKDALRNLEEQGLVLADPPADKRPVREGIVTFADKVIVTFP